ncbi:transglutaminase-like cysteine peptidase [Roseateles koreensis]|uniref:Transglutaminase-like cysteine peptidase n=1 Tax=Roseateles koreensis TaxID=2987526 RepID=A0ABT5KWL7_9BURK|nr:transglutaminase-like cysteine peptidase [Roseateles koreensis]MDC8786743.1 transglutaminase-like cysteine peptidase [Roseateles koreensis]
MPLNAHRIALFRPARLARLNSRTCAAAVMTMVCLLAMFSGSVSQALDTARVLEAAAKHSPKTVSEAKLMLAMIEHVASLDEVQRLTEVNAFFNKHIEFHEDIEVWGKIDYWASPLEALSKGEGDCEDYAIAKYYGLLSAGTPVAKLRMVYVRASQAGRSVAHMVLAYYAQPGAEPLILDNLIADVRPASQRPDLQPVFSFNGEGLWQGVGSTSAGDPLQRLSMWRDLLAKARAEGF